MSRRSSRSRLAAAIASCLLVAGCGVPTSSDVEYVGPGPAAGLGSPGEGEPPPGADDAATPQEQVSNFLQAAAGRPDTADDRVRQFIREVDRQQWDPDGIRVVRLLGDPVITEVADGSWRVELNVQPVGTLRPEGYLDAVTGSRTTRYEFRVVTEGGGIDGDGRNQPPRLRIAEPPATMLLADTALTNDRYFFPWPIYFWDADHEQLVSDLRWLPQAGESSGQHPLIVVEWLLQGPAPALSRLLQGLPAGSQLVSPPIWDGNRLVVDLNAAAVGEGQTVEQLGNQLAWSLLELRPNSELVLKIDGRERDFVPRRRSWLSEPVRMAVLDGVVRPLATTDPPLLPVLSEEVNTGVLAAAVTRSGELAALVRPDGAGRQRLSVVTADDGEATEQSTSLVADVIGQPAWLSAGDRGAGLVVADGRLYRFTAQGGVDDVPVPGVSGDVTAVAVAPERRRLALIAGDVLYMAWLDREGDSITIQDPRPLPTTLRNLDGVAFSHENRLVVAGELDDRVWLYQLTVDGGLEEPLRDLGNASITSLVAHPYEDSNGFESIMYEADEQAFSFTGAPSRIGVEQLIDAPEETEAAPLSPFFLD